MSKLQPSSLPVTRAVLECVKTAGFHFSNDTALVAVQHLLVQTVDLFRTIGAMGLSLKNTFALGKVYSNSPPVIRNLRDMGVTVIESMMPEPGEFRSYFKHDVDRLWRMAAEKLSTQGIKRILVLDDGGVCITSVPGEVLRQYHLCGVEQTSQGMFLFEEQRPAFAVISWARSAVKLRIGGSIFSQCFIEKLNTEFLRSKSIRGESLGVIGLGSIGRAVAKLAARQGFKVLFYDPAPDVLVPESLAGMISRTNTLEELMLACDYVVGCSGRNPFRNKWPMNHRPDIKLLSASGGDQEFGPIINDLKAKPDFLVEPVSWTITSKHGPSGPVQIAYLGYPYNFVSRAPEAVPTQIVQLETGGLLAALVQARLFLQMCETSPVDNRGLHRVAPRAQRLVYESWLKTMKEQGIDLVEVFGYDAGLLSAAEHDEWFSKNTDSSASANYETTRSVEELMTRMVSERRAAKGQSER